MKIQIDAKNKTITLLENVDVRELSEFLNSISPSNEWKILANYDTRVPTEDKPIFKDFNNSPLTQPYQYPPNPFNRQYTGDPILWCGEGTTQAGHDIDIDTVKRSGDIFCYTTDTARMEQGEYLSEYLKNNKDANTI